MVVPGGSPGGGAFPRSEDTPSLFLFFRATWIWHQYTITTSLSSSVVPLSSAYASLILLNNFSGVACISLRSGSLIHLFSYYARCFLLLLVFMIIQLYFKRLILGEQLNLYKDIYMLFIFNTVKLVVLLILLLKTKQETIYDLLSKNLYSVQIQQRT